MRRSTTHVLVVGIVLTALALALGGATPALAHERRRAGHFRFVVGWVNEPVYAGYPNAVQLILSDAGGKPVDDLGDTLKVDVTSAGQTTSIALEAAFEVGEFGTQGDYHANLVPTRPGTYAFHFTGTIRGEKVDATFTCGEKTFDCAKDPSEVQFPAKDPSNADLKTLLDRQAARLAARVDAVHDDASLATTLGYAGIGVGVLALLVALVRGRRPKTTA